MFPFIRNPHIALIAILPALLLLTVGHPQLHAEDGWTLTTADFLSQRVDLKSISASAVRVSSGNAEPSEVSFDRMLLLQRNDRQETARAKYMVNLIGRDRAAGAPVGIEGENLIWNTPSLGRVSLPMKSISSIIRLAAVDAAAGAAVPTPSTEDVVTLSNGDSVRGIISGIDQTNVTVQLATGEKVPASLETVARITFASTAGAAPTRAPASRGFRVSLADSTSLTASKIDMRPDSTLSMLPLADSTSPRSVPMTMVIAIEQVNGPVVWASSLAPSEAIQTSLLDISWPARMDRAVDGSPIRFGDRVFSRGIGVHAYSKLVFAIDPSWKAFRTLYSVAGDWSYANVDVRIKLDGKVVHERTAFRSGVLSLPILVPINGEKQLILEVDFGQNYDVQDRFNWIEPAFLNFRPEPAAAPSTLPQ